MKQIHLQVFYPKSDARIVLRSELDWDRDLPARATGDDGTRWDFVIDTDEHYLYFKPCLIGDDGQPRWSRGTNYLVTSSADEPRRLWPCFSSEHRGTISDAITLNDPARGLRRTVRVYFPPGYDENTLKRYPVLYMHDGSNLFFPDESFGGVEWQVDETLDQLDKMNVIDKVIVVGVYAHDRMNEYTRPGYEGYGRFLVDVLKPKIDRELRTLPGPDTTAVMGSSLGGVVSFFLGFQHPEVFGKVACLSSTFGYRDDLMERVAAEPRRSGRIYLDSGWPEDNYENTTAMRDQLLARGHQFGRDLLYFAFPGAQHDEGAWAARSHIPFQFFFGKVPRF